MIDWTWLVLGTCVAMLAVAALLQLRIRRRREAEAREADDRDTISGWQPQPTRVLTAPERLAYVVLARALPEYMILAQVPLARFLRVSTRRSFQEWLRRIGQLSPDLLVCDSASQVVAAVEVRPPDNQMTPRARERIARMRRVLTAAKIPFHVWTETMLPTPELARAAILPGPAGGPSAAVSPMGAASTGTFDPRPAWVPSAIEQMEPDEVIEMSDPLSTTWFDTIESRPVPLRPAPPAPGPAPAPASGEQRLRKFPGAEGL